MQATELFSLKIIFLDETVENLIKLPECEGNSFYTYLIKKLFSFRLFFLTFHGIKVKRVKMIWVKNGEFNLLV